MAKDYTGSKVKILGDHVSFNSQTTVAKGTEGVITGQYSEEVSVGSKLDKLMLPRVFIVKFPNVAAALQVPVDLLKFVD
jgi:hypothetical protein